MELLKELVLVRSCAAFPGRQKRRRVETAQPAHISEELVEWAKENLLEDELVGALIVEKALSAPLKRIASNAGQNGAVIFERVKSSDFEVGYNAATNELINMFDIGIIDPAKVTRSTLQNAASIASMVLTTECIIVDKPEESVL